MNHSRLLIALCAGVCLGSAGSSLAVDLEATALEVTQSIQDLDNNVRLVEKKTTWVRVHAKSLSGGNIENVVTRIVAARIAPGPVTFLGYIDSAPNRVYSLPNRVTLAQSFNIPLPYSWRFGTVQIAAIVDFDGDFAEDSEDNNTLLETVTFEKVPPLRVRAYGVQFPGGQLPAQTHYDHIASWLRRAYPTSALQLQQDTMATQVSWPNDQCSCNTDSDGNCVGISTGFCLNNGARECAAHVDCGCGWLNEMLAQRRKLDEINDPDFEPDRRYVALVDDAAGFMRGCSPGLAAKIAAGPAGSGDSGWDFDGSYADWYTAHELGHAYGRGHAGCCGAANGAPYPYPMCQIGTEEHAGFDPLLPRTYSAANNFDVMSYCDFQWISDFTFEGIMDQLILEDGAPLPPPKTLGDFAIAIGKINFRQDTAQITNLTMLPSTRARVDAQRGDWELRFLDASGGTLSSHSFAPHRIVDDHDFVVAPIAKDGAVRDEVGIFAETISVPSGAIARLALFHDGLELDARDASANPPTVAISAPNGGETIGRTTTVQWSASDVDGDSLTFSVLYSADAGATWHVLGSDITGSSLAVDLAGLAGGDESLFRVLASDGFHTAFDDSNAVLSVANGLPNVYITDLGDAAVIEVGQTAMFEGAAHDAEDGDLEGDALVWTSDRQGTLGLGSHLALGEELVPGTHVVTLTASDADGGSASATITIQKGGIDADRCPPYPRADCDAADAASLALSDRGGRRKLGFRFRGTGLHSAADFGSPTTTTTQTLCLYAGGRLRDAIAIAPSASAWSAQGERGFRYGDATSDTINTASLRAGSTPRPAAARIMVRGAGTGLPALRDSLPLPVAVQLVNDATTTCFGAELGPDAVRKNQKGSFQAR